MKAIKLASNSVALECLNDGCWARASLASILFCEWIVSLFTLDLSARQGNQSSVCLQHKYVRITGALSILLSARQWSPACPLSCDSLVTLASCQLQVESGLHRFYLHWRLRHWATFQSKIPSLTGCMQMWAISTTRLPLQQCSRH